MTPITRYIENGKGSTLIVGEHTDSCYICVDNGRGGTSMFLTVDDLFEIEAVCRNIRRRIRERG